MDGSRSATTARRPMRQSACPSPIVTVVFPSPGGVGVMEETTTSLPDGASRRVARARTETFATSRPYGRTSSAARPTLWATSAIGRGRDGVTLGTESSCGAAEGSAPAVRDGRGHGGRLASGSSSGSSQSGMAIMRWVSGFQQAWRVCPVATGSPVSPCRMS